MANSTTSPGGTVLTIPANKLWKGSVSLCATLAVTVGGGAATQFPSVTVSATDATWADGDTVIKLALFVPAVGVTALTGSMVTATLATGDITVQTRSAPLTMTLNHGSGVTAVATAVGEII